MADKLDHLLSMPVWEWPGDARDTLLEILTDPTATARDREIAVQLAGDPAVVDDELVEALLQLIADTSAPAELRGSAAIALGPALDECFTEGFDDFLSDPPLTEATFGRVQDTLRALFHDGTVPKLVRRRVLEAAVRAPQDWHTGAIRAAWHGDDEDWRVTAVFCMRYIQGFEPEILAALDRTSGAMQQHAVEAAGEWSINEAWPRLEALLRQGQHDRALILAVVHAVAEIRPDEAEDLVSTYCDLDDPEIEEVLQDALLLAGPPDDDDEDEWDDDDDADDDADDKDYDGGRPASS